MSAYAQFGYTYSSPASQLLMSQGGGGSGGGGCCEGGRTVIEPMSGQPVCSCQYERLTTLGSYRLGSGLGASGGVYGTPYPSSDQNPYPSIGVDSAFYNSLGSSYGVKDGGGAEVSMYGSGLPASPAGYYPYDPTFAAYGYGPGYDLAARRKNATRESTATLKAWLNEHKKNPYPTKGEKIMLAIITKMTLTQVSTWFANARRRLKKENKMTWEPRNKTDDEDAKLSDDEDDEKETGDKDDDDAKKDDKDNEGRMTETKVEDGDIQTELKSCEGGAPPKAVTAALSPVPPLHHGSPFSITKAEKGDCAVSLPSSKPKIWSLADTAACKTPPPTGAVGVVGGGWLAGGTTFPLPPTIPPTQSQYSRFSHLMNGVSSQQYVTGYGDAVGTDTPPQTPPNGTKGGSNGSGVQTAMLGASSGYTMNGSYSSMSSCSRGAQNGLTTGASGQQVENAMQQRYPGANGIQNGHSGTTNPTALQNTAFSPVYKGRAQASSQQMTQQQQGGINNQQIQCQQNSQIASVTSNGYVS